MWASSMPTRRAMVSFSPQVLTNSRYFCRLSKKRKLREGASLAGALCAGPAGAGATRISCMSSRGDAGASTPWVMRNSLTRSRVSGVMRAPSRSRATNLPSLTARRPKVDSAMLARRQNSEMLSSNPTNSCTRFAPCRRPPAFQEILGAPIVGRQPQKVTEIVWDASHAISDEFQTLRSRHLATL